MIDHIGVAATDYAASRRFYDATLEAIGVAPIVELSGEQPGGYRGVGYGAGDKPIFWLGDGGRRGADMHVAFAVSARSQVDALHATAVAAGGRDNGAPGLRPYYHPNYYGAYVLDPDGIDVEAVCHTPE